MTTATPKSPQQWTLLSYRMPREPSTPRIAVWRKLKELGVAQVGDGLVALPHSPQTQEQLEWVAAKVIESDGEAIVWTATPAGRRHSAALIEEMSSERAAEYATLIEEIASFDGPDKRTVQRFRRQFRKIERRDYFRADGCDRARLAIDDLAGSSASDKAVSAEATTK